MATELVVDQLLERSMRTLLENAGAQRGCLVLERGGTCREFFPGVAALALGASVVGATSDGRMHLGRNAFGAFPEGCTWNGRGDGERAGSRRVTGSGFD